MIKQTLRKERTRKRHQRIRNKIWGTKDRPRLSFYKSNKHVYAQLIDDVESKTLLSCSTLQSPLKTAIKSPWTKEAAKAVGEEIAKNAVGKGIKSVVFDRGGNKYHGKVMAFADGARSAGLKF